ncbi:uncharacterized protein TNCV_4313841 [Trichonephila clavipes]|nr:uncharacterized protein TNCV_4313841 [Trichonephila clavipes]
MGVVIHKEEFCTHGIPKQTYKLFQNGVKIYLACHRSNLNMQVSSGTQNNPPFSKRVILHHRNGVVQWFSFAARGLLATDHVILNHGQVTWTTSELAPNLLTTTPHQREDVSALDKYSVHRCPTRWVFSGTGPELVNQP